MRLPPGVKLVAPGEFGTVQSAARGEFPLGFGGQLLAGPSRIGERVAYATCTTG